MSARDRRVFLKRREFVIKELDDLIAKKGTLEIKTKMNGEEDGL